MLILGTRNVQHRGFEPGVNRMIMRVREWTGDVTGLAANDLISAMPGMDVPADWPMLTMIRNAQAFLHAKKLVILPNEFDYLRDGDLLAVTFEKPAARVLFRKNSLHNSFLLTERCNHYCLMCSQPPKDIDDDWIVDELLDAIPLIAKDTKEIGFTGGEPTLLGDRFLKLVREMRDHLPNTALHILSNGRRFSDPKFASAYGLIAHPDVMLGIPVYSAASQVHDYIVQSDGAFDETIRGILNLKNCGQRVELRVVVHKQNYMHLPALAEFIARNLTFVDHVALMGLEMTGFAKANLEELWIDPFEYSEQLYRASSLLDDSGLYVSIYNHQLCTVDRRVWPMAVKSISDWKNEYRAECHSCAVQDQCGGFFATGRLRQSSHIRPVVS